MDIYQNQVKTFEKQNVSFCLLYSFTSLKSCLSSLVPPVPSAVFTHLPWRVLPPSSFLEEISLRSAALPSALSAVHSQSQDFALYLFLPYAALSVCMCVSALGLLVSSCRLPTAVFLAVPSGSDRKNPPAMQETWVWFLAWADSLEESMATHSSVLAWRIPQTEESGRLQSLGSQKVRHDWATKHST